MEESERNNTQICWRAHAFYYTEITICLVFFPLLVTSCVLRNVASCLRILSSFFFSFAAQTQNNIKELGANQKGDGQQNALKYDLCLISFEIRLD